MLLLKRKGHKRHHRLNDHHLGRWFWGFLILGILTGGGYMGMQFYLKETSTIRKQEEIISNMEAILAALDAYHQEHGTYPPAFQMNTKGEKTLSWRVELLPYFLDANGQPRYQDLYDSFNHDQAWNQRDNLGLLDKMPREYRAPQSLRANSDGLTNYLTIRNPHSVFPNDRTPVSKASITDPLDETVVLIEVSDAGAVEWTKPDDFNFNPLKPGSAAPRTFQIDALVCGMCNGKTRVLKCDVDAESLFQVRPKLSPEELEAKNPWTRPFLRDNDSPVVSEESDEQDEVSGSGNSEGGTTGSGTSEGGTAGSENAEMRHEDPKAPEEYRPGSPK